MGYLESGEIKEVKKIIILRLKKYFGPIVQPLDSLSTTMLYVVPDSMWSTVPSKKNLLAAVNKR